jgi:hypothetical protein
MPTSGSSGCAARPGGRDARPAGSSDTTDLGYAVRVVHGGTWGFASGVDLTMDAAAKVASQAVAMAKLSAQVIRAAGADERVELADEPVHADRTWISSYEIDPFTVPDEEKAALLADWSARLLAADGINHVDASLLTVHENKFYQPRRRPGAAGSTSPAPAGTGTRSWSGSRSCSPRRCGRRASSRVCTTWWSTLPTCG